MSMIFSTDDDSNKENDRLVNASSASVPALTSESDLVGLQSIFESFTTQINDCQAVGAAIRANLQRQREELNSLFQTQQKLQRSQQDLLSAFAIWIKNPATPPSDAIEATIRGTPNIADGTITSSQINPVKTTAAFCVGMPNLTAGAFRRYASAINQASSLDDSIISDDINASASSDVRKSAIARDLPGSARFKSDRRPVRSVSAPYDRNSQHFNNIVQNLLGGANWRRAVDLVSHLRSMDKQASSEAVHHLENEPTLSSPPPQSVSESVTGQRLAKLSDNRAAAAAAASSKGPTTMTVNDLKNALRAAKAAAPCLIGRDDYLYIAVVQNSGTGPVIRGEIILSSREIYDVIEVRVESCDDILAIIQWAGDRTRALPSTNSLVSEWDGDFANFVITPSSEEARDHQATIKYIPLAAGASGKELGSFKAMCKDSKFWSRWASSRNGMWKAEISQRDKSNGSAMQRSIKQAGTYQKALAETLQWLLNKCKQENIRTFWYKSREDCFVMDISSWSSNSMASAPDSHKKRLRRQSGPKSSENSSTSNITLARDEKLGCKKRKQ